MAHEGRESTVTARSVSLGQFAWPDMVARGERALPATDAEGWLWRDRLVRARAMAETSAAFTVGAQNMSAVCQELADRLANVLVAGCLIRPLRGGVGSLPIALSQLPNTQHRAIVRLVEAYPHALAAACSARAAEMQGSILVSELSAACLRLWTEQVAWRGLHKLAIHSLVVAPVCASSQVVFGTMVVWRQQPASALRAEDRLFVEEVARRLAHSDPSIN